MDEKQNPTRPKSNAAKRPTAKTKPKPPAKAKAGAAKRPPGRPPQPVPQDKADEIVRRISEGETLRSICRSEHMPTWGTVYDWMEKDPAFAARIARARELGEEAIAQECMDIADDATNDFIATRDGEKLDAEHVQRSKLRIWTRLELLKKWNPRKWGEKVDLNHGVQPENPLAKLCEQVMGTPLKPKD